MKTFLFSCEEKFSFKEKENFRFVLDFPFLPDVKLGQESSKQEEGAQRLLPYKHHDKAFS